MMIARSSNCIWNSLSHGRIMGLLLTHCYTDQEYEGVKARYSLKCHLRLLLSCEQPWMPLRRDFQKSENILHHHWEGPSNYFFVTFRNRRFDNHAKATVDRVCSCEIRQGFNLFLKHSFFSLHGFLCVKLSAKEQKIMKHLIPVKIGAYSMSLLKPYASLCSLLFNNPVSAIKSASHRFLVKKST